MSILKIRDKNGNFIGIPTVKGDKGDKGDKGQDGAIHYTAGTNIEITEDNVINCTASGTAESIEWEDVQNKPTNVSDFENDANYITTETVETMIKDGGIVEWTDITNKPTETDPTVPSYVKNITEANITNWNNKLDSVPNTYKTKEENDALYQPLGEYANKSDIPAVEILSYYSENDAIVTNSSLNYFAPLYDGGKIGVKIGNNLSLVQQTVSFGDREGYAMYGVKIGSGINCVKVIFSSRYANNTTNVLNISSMIYRDRNGVSESFASFSNPAEPNRRITENLTCYIPVQEGDFIYGGAWRGTKSAELTRSSEDKTTSFAVEKIC